MLTDHEIAKELLKIRISQMLINEEYKNGEFKVPIHLAMGHEAIAVAVDNAMEGNDKLCLSHRNLHYNLARSKSLKPEIDEYLLKPEGLAGGRLGSMNLANPEKGIIYTSSILGNNLAVATGVALSKKVKKEDGLVIVQTGDGAMEEGCFYETLVFMKSNDLPALIIIENNEWSLATRIKERRCHIEISKICESISAGYELFKSNDVYEYIERIKQLRKRAIEEKTPICIEVDLTTLGYWHMKTDDHPDGKFINYHAGPTPSVDIKGEPMLDKSIKDPLFVLYNHFDKQKIKEMSKMIVEELNKEIQ